VQVKNAQKRHPLDERLIKRMVVEVLGRLGGRGGLEIEVILVNDASIESLNKRYLNKTGPTDVISFDLDRSACVFVSVDTAFRSSGILGTGFVGEIMLYVIHGILHLFGYDDDTKASSEKMSAKQDDILRRLCRKHDLSKALMPR
jgi:probable rRNA maturation factor